MYVTAHPGSITWNGAAAGTQRFLRGAPNSGVTGGEDKHALAAAELAAHTHDVNGPTATAGFAGGEVTAFFPNAASSSHITTASSGGGVPHENRPSFYEVVWIMRVK